MANNSANAESLDLRIARNHADEYEQLIKQSKEACDCQDCQTCMKFGIHQFDWLIDTDQRYRSALYKGKSAHDPKLEQAIEFLMRRWHHGCADVIKWAKHHVQLGFDVAYLDEFQQRCEESAAIIRSLDEGKGDRMMSDPLILLRDQALEEHRDGQTAEFF